MAVFKCKMCGASLEIAAGATVIQCEYCSTQQTLPKLDDDKRANLYDRANHFRRSNEYDKAMAIYEQILMEDNTDAEAYWSLVLCRFGIEYVEDPATHKRIPTVNRAQLTSIYDDDNYKSALQHADPLQRGIYEKEAHSINEIQKGILAISQKEEPFDIFICYKESDFSGRRTPDSVLAQELYYQLTKEGFKVFFSRITLEDKLGSAYEPYIFAALNSAKIMVVLGTKTEYFNATWVKNEWSRYLALIKQGQDKMLIPAYRDMNPYDLPVEFSHLQALDMSKLGFMQDLIHGIKKIMGVRANPDPIPNPKSNAIPQDFITRVDKMLKAKDFANVFNVCRSQTQLDPSCAPAYLYQLLAKHKLTSMDELPNVKLPYESSALYHKLYSYADAQLRDQLDTLSKLHKQNWIPQMPEIVNGYRTAIVFTIGWAVMLFANLLLSALGVFDTTVLNWVLEWNEHDELERNLVYTDNDLYPIAALAWMFFFFAFLFIRYLIVRNSKTELYQKKLHQFTAKFGLYACCYVVVLLLLFAAAEEYESFSILAVLPFLWLIWVDLTIGISALITFHFIPSDIKMESGETSLKLGQFLCTELKKIFQGFSKQSRKK